MIVGWWYVQLAAVWHWCLPIWQDGKNSITRNGGGGGGDHNLYYYLLFLFSSFIYFSLICIGKSEGMVDDTSMS